MIRTSLRPFLISLVLKNLIKCATRTTDRTSTSLDVIASCCDPSFILASGSVSVKPLSDHDLVYVVFGSYSKKAATKDTVFTSSLNIEKLDRLKLEFEKIPFESIELFSGPEDMLKKLILDCLNQIAPLKEIRLNKSYVPWFDAELTKMSTLRDKLHKKAMTSSLKKESTEYSLFIVARNRFRNAFRSKMNAYYEEKSDFKKN
jgi:hypothetical protein